MTTRRKATRRPQRSRAIIENVLEGMAKLSEHLAAAPTFEVSPSKLSRLPKRERVAVHAALATSVYIFDLIGEALRT